MYSAKQMVIPKAKRLSTKIPMAFWYGTKSSEKQGDWLTPQPTKLITLQGVKQGKELYFPGYVFR